MQHCPCHHSNIGFWVLEEQEKEDLADDDDVVEEERVEVVIRLIR